MIDSNTKISKTLIRAGLTENEASIYLCLIRLGESTAFQISKNTSIPRATVYFTLDILAEKGLVTISKKNNVSYYYSEGPNKLINSARENLELIKEIAPEIAQLATDKGMSPKSTIYMGASGVKNAFEDIIEALEKSKVKHLYAISSSEIFSEFQTNFKLWQKRREKAGIYTRLIAPLKDRGILGVETNEMRETRYVDSDFPLNSPINMYENKVVFFVSKEKVPYVIVIESETISSSLKKMFMFMWDIIGKTSR